MATCHLKMFLKNPLILSCYTIQQTSTISLVANDYCYLSLRTYLLVVTATERTPSWTQSDPD